MHEEVWISLELLGEPVEPLLQGICRQHQLIGRPSTAERFHVSEQAHRDPLRILLLACQLAALLLQELGCGPPPNVRSL